ncbi:MAG: PIN domain-containing protein [Coriobacteriales bacterium]|jgi:predicted nucleic acid-binding protein|nr:PIN domain-containing protein [Coriobacteriales bacterium]
MRVLIDTNVIVDVLERREAFFDSSYAVVKLAAEGKLDAFTSAGSIADAYYIIRKGGKSPVAARDAIAALLQLIHACDTTASDVTTALTLGVVDFEDSILAATARREKAEYIITRNERDFSQSPVPAVSPADFMAQTEKEMKLCEG